MFSLGQGNGIWCDQMILMYPITNNSAPKKADRILNIYIVRAPLQFMLYQKNTKSFEATVSTRALDK